jgi:hypothetical protein
MTQLRDGLLRAAHSAGELLTWQASHCALQAHSLVPGPERRVKHPCKHALSGSTAANENKPHPLRSLSATDTQCASEQMLQQQGCHQH